MRGREPRRPAKNAAVVAALLPALLGACGTNPVPADRRVTPEAAVMSGRGAYAVVQRTGAAPVAGELIAPATGGIWVVDDGASALVYVPYFTITKVEVGVHDNHAGAAGAWVGLGTASALTHGFWAIFTVPIWLATGIPMSVRESRYGVFACPPEPLSLLTTYARFPQGLPPGVGYRQLSGAPASR